MNRDKNRYMINISKAVAKSVREEAKRTRYSMAHLIREALYTRWPESRPQENTSPAQDDPSKS
jgi:hypothetical protein